jgi:nicotinamidase-related amidase
MKYLALIPFLLFTPPLKAEKEKPAVLLIDMQRWWWEKEANIEGAENRRKFRALLESQKRVLREARNHNVPILIVEFAGYGETLSELIEAVGDYDNFLHLKKNRTGLFSRRNKTKEAALAFLRERNVKDLIVMGANGEGCVASTIIQAIRENFRVIAYPYGIADFNHWEIYYPYFGRKSIREGFKGSDDSYLYSRSTYRQVRSEKKIFKQLRSSR